MGTGVGDAQLSSPVHVSGTTYRYRISDSNPANDVDTFVNGLVTVDFAANKWIIRK